MHHAGDAPTWPSSGEPRLGVGTPLARVVLGLKEEAGLRLVVGCGYAILYCQLRLVAAVLTRLGNSVPTAALNFIPGKSLR